MLLLVKSINKKKIQFIDATDKKDLANNDKEMSDKSEVAEIPEIKQIILKSNYTAFKRLKLGIESI